MKFRTRPYGPRAIWIELLLDASDDGPRLTRAARDALVREFPDCDVGAGDRILALVGTACSPAVDARIADALRGAAALVVPSVAHEIPVAYDGPDLAAVLENTNLSRDAFVDRLSEHEFIVQFSGFLPGFSYLGPNPEGLSVPRRLAPRPRVASGSVALGGPYAGIYPFESPGGWQLIGRTNVRLFDPTKGTPSLFAPGDRVRWIESSLEVEPLIRPRPKALPANGKSVRIDRTLGLVTIQDSGRKGSLSQGVAASGPLDPEALVRANARLGNAAEAAVFEVLFGRLELTALDELWVCVDGEKPIPIARGESFCVGEGRRAVRYLAIAGGVDVPLVLGSRSTLAVARLGGHLGRGLRSGDVVPVGNAGGGSVLESPFEEELGAPTTLRVAPGPMRDEFSEDVWAAFLGARFVVSRAADRTGVRLEGWRAPRRDADLRRSFPLIRGAIQVSSDGTPIVLGPDHPVTGGYPVIAVLLEGSWGKLASLRPGGSLALSE